MADYYSILKKTIGSLPENNGAARRGVYSRARTAIVKQLKAYEPPLSPSEITAEQLRLEEAIRKVEAEAARESLGLNAPRPASTPVAPPPVSKPAPFPSGSGLPDAPKSDLTPRPTEAPSSAPAPSVSASKPLFGESKSYEPKTSSETFSSSVSRDSERTGSSAAPVFGETKKEAAPSVSTSGSSFGASAAASGGSAYAVDDASASSTAKSSELSGLSASKALPDDMGADGSASDFEAYGAADNQASKAKWKLPVLPLALVGALLLIIVGIGAVVYSQKDTVADFMASTSDDAAGPNGLERIEPVAVEDTPDEAGETDTASSKIEDRVPGAESSSDAGGDDYRSVATTVITPGDPVGEPSTTTAETAGETAPTASEETSSEAIASVSPEDSSSTTPSVSASTSSDLRSILYEEGDDTNSAGTAAQGTVVWRLLDETSLSGVDQKILVADVTVPERNVGVSIRIKPNDDKSLPASHLVEIKYDFPDDFSSGDVVNVPGLVMKPTEEARGDALIGASVKVSPGYFWIALSNITSEAERNVALLRDRGWIDIPMLYSSGRRGILTLEKGEIGTQLVNQAIATWSAN